MGSLSLPVWELVARAALVYAGLLFLIRLSGRRTVGQFTPFDLLVVMLLSEAVSNALTGSDPSLTAGLISAATLIGMNWIVAAVTARNAAVKTALEGEPILVGKDGRLLTAVLTKLHIPETDVLQALRKADCDLSSMQCAFLETDGCISILKKQGDG